MTGSQDQAKQTVENESIANAASAELMEFNSTSGELPASVEVQLAKTRLSISSELEASRRKFLVSYLLFSALGYFLSLSLCSQNSIALTKFSINVAAILHQLPDPLCPIVCGVFFSFLPMVSVFLFLDRFQLRRMVVAYWWLPALTTFLSCLVMSLLPESLQHDGMHMNHSGMRDTRSDVVWLIWWTIAAVAIPALIAVFAKSRLRIDR
ncbi:MAG: hypothetical protein ACO3A4_00680 [Silvanigrellaceae bacterium]